jgi:hypothetical protein
MSRADTVMEGRKMATSAKTRSPEETVRAFVAAMNTHSWDKAQVFLAKDFQRFGEHTNWGPMSRTEYELFWTNFMEPFDDDYQWEILTLVSNDEVVAAEILESGTFTRPWVLEGVIFPPDLQGLRIEPNNVSYKGRVTCFFWIKDGLIQKYHYLQDSTFMRIYGPLMTRAK